MPYFKRHQVDAPDIDRRAQVSARLPSRVAQARGALPASGTPAPAATDDATRAARVRLVREHLRVENLHDIDATLATMSRHPCLVINGENLSGHERVARFYRTFFHGFPDLTVNVDVEHVSDDAVILEIRLTGTHLGVYESVAPTGNQIEVPLCAVFKFDEVERILGEWVFYDRGLLMQQITAAP